VAERLGPLREIVVPVAKLVGYLLNREHPKGRGKAKFLAQFGFGPDRIEVLAGALIRHLDDHGIAAAAEGDWGLILHAEGPLVTPSGARPMVRTVWIVKPGREDAATFVTLKPLPKRP
jgi:hypothetical protein